MGEVTNNVFKGIWLLILSLSRRRKIQLSLILALSVISAIFEIVSVSALIPFMEILGSSGVSVKSSMFGDSLDGLKEFSGNDFALHLTLIFIFLSLASGILRYCLLWAQTRVTHAIGADLSINIYRRTLYQPYVRHIESNSSDVISSISTKVDRLVRESLISVLLVISSILMSFALIAFLFYIEPVVAVSTFGTFGAIYLIIILLSRKYLTRDSEIINKYQNRVFKALQEGLGGIKDVIINRTQEAFVEEYKHADLPLRRAHANIAIIGGAPRFALEALGFVTFAVVAFILRSNETGAGSATSLMALFAISALRVIPLLQQAYTGVSNIIGSRSILFDILYFIQLPMGDPNEDKNIKPIKFDSTIRVDQVSFRFKENGRWILKDLTFDIPHGSRVGIVGSTGSGKSTFLNVLMGLLSPTSGRLLVDSENIDYSTSISWRQKIAYVPQDIFLSDATIAENIALGTPLENIDFERIQQSAKLASIYDDIIKWPDGFKTRVGERGVNLSGGQKQRIGISRALYKNPEVLIFDEATSALDMKTENDVMQSIDSLDKHFTIIMVAHRVDTLRNCNIIIELDKGTCKSIKTNNANLMISKTEGNH